MLRGQPKVYLSTTLPHALQALGNEEEKKKLLFDIGETKWMEEYYQVALTYRIYKVYIYIYNKHTELRIKKKNRMETQSRSRTVSPAPQVGQPPQPGRPCPRGRCVPTGPCDLKIKIEDDWRSHISHIFKIMALLDVMFAHYKIEY